MSKFEISFELIQHTPIIHFQGDQAGATLRATELKPKLDEFISKKFEKLGEKIDPNWRISKLHPALDYKVKIEAREVSLAEINNNNPSPMFFGDINNDESTKRLSFTNEPIKITFNSFNEKILDEIEKYFKEFMFKTNFGTRQSKGYGSFFLKDSAPDEFVGTPYFYFSRNNVQASQYTKVLEVINFHYQRLKSGINYRGVYFHSFLKKHLFTNENYTWEKRWLKEKFFNKGLRPNTEVEKFARIMLGYNSSYFFKTTHNPRGGEVYPDRNLDVTVFHENDQITRFKSPITYKPLFIGGEWRIFIILEEINKDVLNKNFHFYRGKISANQRSHRNSFELKTPDDALDLNVLIDAYHVELGRNWEAYLFQGPRIGVLNSGKL